MKSLGIRNEHDIRHYARDVSENFLHRGSDTTAKLASAMRFIKEETGLRNLSKLEESHVENILDSLRENLKSGAMSSSTVNGYISSLNNIVRYVGKPELSVRAKDEGLTRKYDYAKNKENTQIASRDYKTFLLDKYSRTGDIKYMAVYHAVSLQRNCNLRLEESIGVKVLTKDPDNLRLTKNDHTKHGRTRTIKLYLDGQKQAVKETKSFLRANRLKNLNISGSMRQGINFMQNTLKEFKEEIPSSKFHYHGERQAWAHDKYSYLWEQKGFKKIECPAKLEMDKKEWLGRISGETGLTVKEIKGIDREIRQEITRDLGHESLQQTRKYLG